MYSVNEDDEAGPRQRAYTMFSKEVKTKERTAPTTLPMEVSHGLVYFVENYHQQIIWLVLYTLVIFGIFIERCYCKRLA